MYDPRADEGPKVCRCIGKPIPKYDDLGLRCQKCGGDLLKRYSPKTQVAIKIALRDVPRERD